MLKHIIGPSIVFLSFTFSAPAQNVSSDFCSRVDLQIVQPMQPSNIAHAIVFAKTCDFDFSTKKGERVLLEVRNHDSKKEAVLDAKQQVLALGNRSYPEKWMSDYSVNIHSQFWNQSYLYISNHADHVLVLRRGNYVVVVISTDPRLLFQIELNLRSFSLN